MKILERCLFRLAWGSWMFVAWLLSTETGLLPARLRGDGMLFRWQIWLLAGVVSFAGRDLLGDLRCRCCGSREDLSVLALFTRSRELLCRRCLRWDTGEPVAVPAHSSET